MRLAFLILFISSLVFAKSSIDSKINTTNKRLKKFDKTYTNVHKSLASTAKKILIEERTILKQQRTLQKLQLELSLKEQKYQDDLKEVKLLRLSQDKLQTNQEKLRQDLAFLLAKNVSLSMILDDEKAKNAEAMITEEVFETLNKITKDNIVVLQKSFTLNINKIATTQKRIDLLKITIADIDNKRKEVLSITKKKKTNLKDLKTQKNKYRKSVKKLLSQQSSLKNELAKLNIIKEDEKAKKIAKAKEKKRLALLKKQTNNRAKPTKNLPKVKSRTDAYSSVKTKKYRGKKTIAPLDSYSLVKKFGPYEDPIYHIKIFNESISLKPKNANAKVKNVLNGKVILAKRTSLLNNIVIVEHKNGMHTIYAHLDKVAPTIKKGKRLKKGAIIGRVNNELMFEVTQKNYHINPMQLIYKSK